MFRQKPPYLAIPPHPDLKAGLTKTLDLPESAFCNSTGKMQKFVNSSVKPFS